MNNKTLNRSPTTRLNKAVVIMKKLGLSLLSRIRDNREELIAELSAALMAFYMGMETTIRDDHAAYLKYWLEALDRDSGFLMDVLSDVVQCVKYMCTNLRYNPFDTDVADARTPGNGGTAVRERVLTDELVIAG